MVTLKNSCGVPLPIAAGVTVPASGECSVHSDRWSLLRTGEMVRGYIAAGVLTVEDHAPPLTSERQSEALYTEAEATPDE